MSLIGPEAQRRIDAKYQDESELYDEELANALQIATVRSFRANAVHLPGQIDLDYGEGRLTFEWADPLFGREGLRIEIDPGGFCSRFMPIRSGSGYPVVKELERDRIVLRFPQALAKRLELDEEIEILFSLTDEEFQLLQRTIEDIKNLA